MSGGRFIISLDFELMWGVRDHRTAADYGDAVLGGRTAIPLMLEMFTRYGVRATWATVGLLFARTRDEMIARIPAVEPAYDTANLSPYAAVRSEIGKDEEDDPLHFGRSLIDRIAQTEGQEISTHTFSHYYTLEPGQTLEAFSADLSAAIAIAQDAGFDTRSIVFPRNQMTEAHIAACAAQGVSVYRGNPAGFANDPRAGHDNTKLVRGARLLDSILPVFGRPSVAQPTAKDGALDVKASRFLRPWQRKLPLLSRLQCNHIITEMRHAARTGENYHLWWHPHNMGRNTGQNMAQLERILQEFRTLRDRHGMTSAHMLDVSKAGAT